MEQDYNLKKWSKGCPNTGINCRRSSCGIEYVFIPAALGDDQEGSPVAPKNGAYCNTMVKYAANNNIYLYSSEGVPVLVDENLWPTLEEMQEDIDTLDEGLANEIEARTLADQAIEEEIEHLRNNPDVVDIVATYADLVAYDTSELGDKDVIRVLTDETHDDESTYYRWNKPNQEWVFIGAVEGYYTKDQTDDLLADKQNVLTAGDNISITNDTISAVDTTYTAGNGLSLNDTEFSVDTSVIQEKLTAGSNISIDVNNEISAVDTTYTAGSGLNLSGTEFSVDTTTIQPILTFDSTPTANSTNPVTSEGIKTYVDEAPAFKPFPASVTTDGTTQQLMSSILALSPETGTAYLGTVELSDMPDGLIQEEVEVYVYSDYVVYCIMRSTDVSPYAWWCASYNYQGWQPVNTDTTYTAGTNVSISNENVISAVDTTYSAGANISIDANNEISATDTTYTAGNGLSLSGTEFSVDNSVVAFQTDLPTVNDATLTIQKNSTDVGTFTANASSNSTINITVPTTAAEVSALPDSTKYAASISLTINSSTYVVTAQLKDQDNNNIGSSQTIDLPLESVVVSGSYDSQTKEVVLTLQGGSTIRFSVADLVSGLQSEITSQNPLDADLVDDSTSTNKFVTAADITAWNGKQDALMAGSNISISGTTISATDTTYSNFTGATSQDAGTAGLVPAPTTSDPEKYLKGDGTWATPPGTTYSAGTNIQINGTTISATDTTYSAFTGTDGQAAGTSGLVPAPATTDAGKFLKADGTWDTTGSSVNVVQTTGTSTTDVMSQNAVTSMVFDDPGSGAMQRIKIGGSAVSTGASSVAIGYSASATGYQSVAIGQNAQASNLGSISLGAFSTATYSGQMDIGTSNALYGYNNNSNYRLLTGLYDPQSAHDAATKGYVDSVTPTITLSTTDIGEGVALPANTLYGVYE